MNKIFAVLSCLLAFALIALLYSRKCLEKPIPATNSLDFKHAPSDLFFLQRAYPENQFDLKAYEAAFRAARLATNNRSGGSGFDTPWVEQGPGNIGARVNAIAVHPNDPQIIYAGFSTGGIFKTIDGGQNWFPIFDDQMYLSIGDITLNATNPDIVYVGTGDPNISGYPFIGDGVYKSADGGQTWAHLGLKPERIVSRIVLDPSQPGTIYAACMGIPFERNSERGLYKSTDDGANWSKVLYINDSTGIIDLLIDPNNPQTLYAAAWNRIRNNTESMIAGPDAKIYKTTDGGQNWSVLSNGLPSGVQGRIGLCMSGINSQTLFASYINPASQLQGVYKTTNGGQNWSTVTLGGQNGLNGTSMGGFGWYFGQIRVNPTDDNHLFLLGVQLWETTNGGGLWVRRTSMGVPVHVDNHDLVFAAGSKYLGTDGGLYKASIGTTAWEDIENIPTNQFYRVGYNPHQPDTYYGGAQDNGSLAGNQAQINQWERLAGGDGFQSVFHPTDSMKFYVESQNGNISVTTNGGDNFFTATAGINFADQRNWDMPYFMSPHRADHLFTGTYRVYRAQSPSFSSPWYSISPDLTNAAQSSSTANFHTISTLDQSPIDSTLLYVGTSDGNVWRSTNLGGSWEMIKQGLPNRYVTDIKADPDSANHLFVTFSGYKYNDFTPHIFKSIDRGDNWFSINGDLPQLAINDFLILPNRGGQHLFVATDGGVYGSLDGGQNWHRLGGNMPFIPVYDIVWNKIRNEIVAGTFARSIMSFPIDSLQNSTATALVSGTVRRADGVVVPNVNLFLDCDGEMTTYLTDNQGSYLAEAVVNSPACQLLPSKNTDHRNGITSFDLLTIQKHILGVDPLDSPYEYIAADVNKSSTITTFDIVLLRKLLLFIDTAFTQNESWRFVKKDYAFADPANPLAENFPERHDCSGQADDQPNTDFVAVKIGDLNQSNNPSNFDSGIPAEGRTATHWQLANQEFNSGDRVEVAFTANNIHHYPACQFTIAFDPAALQFVGIDPGELPDIGATNFGLRYAADGKITFSWHTTNGKILAANSILYMLNFKALKNASLQEVITINSSLIASLAFTEEGISLPIVLQFTETTEQHTAFNCFPLSNPIVSRQSVSVVIEGRKGEEVEILIFDLRGRLLYQEEIILTQDRHIHNSPSLLMQPASIYLLRCSTKNESKTCKLISQ